MAASIGAARWLGAVGLAGKPCRRHARPAARLRGFDNQRLADLGNGRIAIRSWPAIIPILRSWDGDDYYMTFSTFDSYPGLVIWHSRDLLNWQPVTAALTQNVGAVWAPDLCRHDGRYFIYFAAKAPQRHLCDLGRQIAGPWSAPIDLGLPDHIDPAMPWARMARAGCSCRAETAALAADGLSTIGAVQHVYDPWRYSDARALAVEGFSPEAQDRFPWRLVLSDHGGRARPACRPGTWSSPRAPAPSTGLGKTARTTRSCARAAGKRLVVARPCHADPGRAATGGRSITGSNAITGRWAARPCSIRWNGPPMAGSA
jgi:hypothetical protein